MRALRKTKASDQPTVSDWDVARERWAKVQGQAAHLVAQYDGAKLAVSLTKSPSDTDRVPENLRQLAAPFMKIADSAPDDLVKKIVELDEQIRAHGVVVQYEHERFAAAQREETNRRALALQPDHRKVVADMARAIRALSEAIQTERDIRRSLGPLPSSAYLPDASSILQVGTLDELNSRLRQWTQEIDKLGILK